MNALVSSWGRNLATGILSLAVVAANVAWGEPQKARTEAAQAAVKEALQREIYGLVDERAELLRFAADKAPDYAPAMWHLGRVKDARNRWASAEDFIQQWSSSRKIKQYLAARESARDTLDGQLQLAEFCRREGLTDQMRAHLARVIEIEPNHAAARRALGFVRMGPLWLSPEAASAEASLGRQREASLEKCGREMEEIADGLASDSRARRAAAAERLAKIGDASAIAAMELVLSPKSDDAAMAVIATLASIADPQASLSLARHAVFYPSLQVREAACKALARRDEHSYVPALVEMMVTSVSSRIVTAPLPGGRIGYRHAFVRETQDREELLVLDTEYVRINRGGSQADATRRAALAAQGTALAREWGIEQQNRITQRLNDRIAWVLNLATQQDLPASAETWWKWWNDRNERLADQTKTQVVSQQYNRVQISDPVPITGFGGGTTGGGGGGECFVAGTLVWTAGGPMAIEQVQRGDLVLSQDVDSGELAFKPVLRATTRPAGPIVKLTAGSETFECSSGHVFWVSGEGWKKASELSSGMLLHSAGGPKPLVAVDTAAEAPTYNLVVADFATYFVGQQKVLSHDFTLRKATSAQVPGLKPE